MVERGPEKAGVGGSIPSLATNNSNNLAIAKNIQISSRVQYANIHQPKFPRWALAKRFCRNPSKEVIYKDFSRIEFERALREPGDIAEKN